MSSDRALLVENFAGQVPTTLTFGSCRLSGRNWRNLKKVLRRGPKLPTSRRNRTALLMCMTTEE